MTNKQNMRQGITLREYNFLKYYIDIGSDTFGNAYQSALRTGYSKTYARVIKKHFATWRMKLLKNTLKADDLVKIIKATKDLDIGPPEASEREIREIIRKNEKELDTPSLKEIIKELEELF